MYLQIAVPPQIHIRKHNDVAVNNLVVSLFISLPLLLLLMIIGYRKYQVYVFQRRIERLKRMWKLN